MQIFRFDRVVWYFLVDINECESFPCKNGGTCTDLIAGYRCDCIPGHTGEDCETSLLLRFSVFV